MFTTHATQNQIAPSLPGSSQHQDSILLKEKVKENVELTKQLKQVKLVFKTTIIFRLHTKKCIVLVLRWSEGLVSPVVGECIIFYIQTFNLYWPWRNKNSPTIVLIVITLVILCFTPSSTLHKVKKRGAFLVREIPIKKEEAVTVFELCFVWYPASRRESRIAENCEAFATGASIMLRG